MPPRTTGGLLREAGHAVSEGELSVPLGGEVCRQVSPLRDTLATSATAAFYLLSGTVSGFCGDRNWRAGRERSSACRTRTEWSGTIVHID